jgi:hypothetical protein
MFEPKKYFTTARRKYIESPLKELGFKKYKTAFIGRMTNDNVFQFFDFQKSAHGKEQFTLNVTIRPMYCPHDDYLTLLPGNRLCSMATNGKKDKWWNYSTEDEANSSFEEIYNLLTNYAIPFFNSTMTSYDIIKTYEKNIFGVNKFGNKVEWGTVGWENYDLGHIYLKARDNKKAIKQFDLCYEEFIKDERDWAQKAAKECMDIKTIINSGQIRIDKYLDDTINESKLNLKLTEW